MPRVSQTVATFGLIVLTICSQCFAQGLDKTDADPATLSADRLTVSVVIPAKQSKIVIPNYHAMMRSISIVDSNNSEAIALTPLVDSWEIKLGKQFDEPVHVEIELDTPAIETAELPAIRATPDGGFRIPAAFARVVSKKLRYENLPHKNTVGYWVELADYAYFLIDIDSPASWNVAVLQGCGAGQGGSSAQLSLVGPLDQVESFENNQVALEADIASSVDFKVKETGHFQNFQWRHLGTLSAESPGIYAVKVSAVEIAKNAVMDVREIQLTKIP